MTRQPNVRYCRHGTFLYDFEDCTCDQIRENDGGWFDCPYNDNDSTRRCPDYPKCKYGHPEAHAAKTGGD
jgi:hypothetical protein